MLKKYLTTILAVLILNLACGATAFAGNDREKEAKFAEKVKSKVIKLGTGSDARIEVKMKDGTKLKGYVSQVDESSFLLINEKTASAVVVPYPSVKQVTGNNLATGVKIVIGVAIVLAVLVIIGLNSAD